MHLAYELCIELGHDVEYTAAKLGVHVRTVRRYISISLQRHDAKQQLLTRQPAKHDLNSFFELLGKSAPIEIIDQSDPIYFDWLVRTLTNTQRKTLNSFFYERLTVLEIAAEYNVSIAAIERRLERIKAKFRALGLPYPVRHALPRERRVYVDLNAI